MIGDVWWGDIPPGARPSGMVPTYEDDDPIVARTARGCLGVLVGLLAVAVVVAWWLA